MKSDICMKGAKKALVYNRFLETAGGGERACLDMCVALEQLGYQVTLATFESFKGSLGDLCAVFGIAEYTSWKLQRFSNERAVGDFCQAESFDLFVNSTFCSSLQNPAPLGVYMLMFPQHIDPFSRQRLTSYDLVLPNSEFSKLHLEYRWGADFPCKVLPPPISKAHSSYEPQFDRKEPLILLVGRFNLGGHSKCQLEAIKAFKELKDRGVLGEQWRLHIAGNVNPGAENRQYFEACCRESRDDITLESNVPFAQLQELYARATCLWQFTGLHVAEGTNPELCEHLGLVAMDSLCYGTIPVVYQRSGMSYLLDYGSNGFFFADKDELASIMAVMHAGFRGPQHRRLFDAAREGSGRLNFSSFLGTIERFLSEAIASQAA